MNIIKFLIIGSSLIVLTAASYFVFQYTQPKKVETTVVSIVPTIEPKVTPSPTTLSIDYKNFETLKKDIGPEVVNVEKPGFFENDSKEQFAKYQSTGTNCVAKYVNNKWVKVGQCFNGSPECKVLDDAGVPYKVSTIELACAVNGNLRAESNPADKKAYSEFWK